MKKRSITIPKIQNSKKNDGLRGCARIGIFTRPIDQGYSGSGHFLLEIVCHMMKLNDGSFDFTLIHYEKNDKPIYASAKELVVPRNPLAAAATVRSARFDIVHYAPLSPYTPFWGVKAKKVAMVLGAEPYLVPELYGFAHRFHAKFTKPWLAKRMDALVTVSQTSRDFLAVKYAVPAERFTVCHSGVGPAYNRLPEAEIKAPAKFGIRSPYILHLSNFSERKNPETIMRGFAEFRKSTQGQESTLVLAGRGWRNERTLALAASLGISNCVVFPGFVSEREVVELLNGALCFLFPSLAEGFGMPNIEAMACGCPVITSSVFAIPEVVGDAALLLDNPRDHLAAAKAMNSLVSDSKLRKSLVERGFKRIEAFSWNDSARSLLDLYKKMLGTVVSR